MRNLSLTRSRPASAMRRRSAGSFRSSRVRFAASSTLVTRNPDTPSSIWITIPPTFPATTGTPFQSASATTRPNRSRLAELHVLVLERQRVDRRRLDQHPLLEVRAHELGHRPDGGVVLLDEGPEKRPHRLIRGREIDVATPHPPAATRILREVAQCD